MFAIPTKVGISHQVVATLVAVAVVLWSIGAYATAQAANLINVSDTLGTSEPGVTSSHEFAFTVPAVGGTAITSGNTITLTFPTDTNEFANVDTVVGGDLTVTVAAAATTTVFGAATDGGAFSTITFSGITVSPGQEVVVAIASGKITNPTVTGSYQLTVSAPSDYANTEVAIVDTVLVTAQVDTNFIFQVIGTATGTPVNGTTTTGTTQSDSIPFGLLTAGEIKTMAQDLTVETNARYGFAVTVETDGNIRSVNGADIDMFNNGTEEVDPTNWASPIPNVNNENTWGHWGFTTEDSDLNAGVSEYATEFGANQYVAASTTPRSVFHHNNPADGSTPNIGSTTVGYQVEITGLQEAADDYQAILTYIATPVF